MTATPREGARDLFEIAFSQAPIGMTIVGLDGRFLKVNRAMCRMTGWSEEELLDRVFADITHHDDLEADLEFTRRLLAGEIPDFQMEKRYLSRCGGETWTALSVSLARDEHGAPTHFVSQVQDISARKRAERQLRRAEEEARRERDHAQTILSAMHEGYALTTGGEITAVNDALCELTGFPREELIGSRPPHPFWPPDSTDELTALRNRILAGRGGSFETTFMRPDGTRYDVEVTAKPAFGAEGELLGFVNTMRDVSLRNREQRELERRARTDSLTGLANRYVLEESLSREVTRRAEGPVALVLLDVDHFKQVNDAHGHPAGDAVLIEVARRLARTVRESEVIARVGGEEFAWLLSDCDETGARAAADRARAAIAADPFGVAGELTLSAGIGIAETPCDPHRLYELADTGLYEAKQAGRDRTCSRQADEPTTMTSTLLSEAAGLI